MNYLGLDVSKDEIILYDYSNQQHHAISNNQSSIQNFFHKNKFDNKKTIVGCESTADYHLVACSVALNNGFTVKIINPILTKQIISSTIRKKKTDFSDSQIIAKLLKDNQGQTISMKNIQTNKRTLLRTEQRITQCSSDLKRLKKSLQEKAKVMDVQDAIEAIDKCIETLSSESKQLVSKATTEQDRQEELIDSIPGCGEKLSAIISSEAGDITRFPSSTQFKAYVGIDPKVSQSGNSLHTGRITKRGNAYLRHALFLAANIARNWDPVLKDFYDKKRSEGKSHRHTVCAVSRKLCERIYAIVSKNEFYKKNFI